MSSLRVTPVGATVSHNPRTADKRVVICTVTMTALLTLIFTHVGEAAPVVASSSRTLPAWTQEITRGHPRLFFNAQTWSAVRERALGAENQWYLSIKAKV